MIAIGLIDIEVGPDSLLQSVCRDEVVERLHSCRFEFHGNESGWVEQQGKERGAPAAVDTEFDHVRHIIVFAKVFVTLDHPARLAEYEILGRRRRLRHVAWPRWCKGKDGATNDE